MFRSRQSLHGVVLSGSLVAVLVGAGVTACGDGSQIIAPAPVPLTGKGTLSSGPVQVSPDGKTVWVVNPNSEGGLAKGSVTRLDVSGAVPTTFEFNDASINEPRNLAISPDGKIVVVANGGGRTLSVIDASANPPVLQKVINVGAEPYGVAFTPNGSRIYVANARENTVSVISATTLSVLTTVGNVGLEPRGIAITNDGDADDNDEKVYVTQFIGVDRANVVIGADDYKEGHVAVIATATDTVTRQAVLPPMQDTGFKSNGSLLQGIPAVTPAAFTVLTKAFPNMMQAVAIKGDRAYFPNTCASPDAPVRFNVNVQSCISVLNTSTDAQGLTGAGAPQILNMNRGVTFETAPSTAEENAGSTQRLFHAVPWAIAFKRSANEGYAVSLSSNVVIKVVLDAEGTPSINALTAAAGAPSIATSLVRIAVGQGPRGIAINPDDTRAYVANENSRDVSVIDLSTNQVLASVRTTALPANGSDAARRLIGKALFESSTGINLPLASGGAAVLTGTGGVTGSVVGRRLSSEGWGSCYACHGFGKTDGVVWMFGNGPRRSLPLHASFDSSKRGLSNALGTLGNIKALNYSGVNDEVQDFELNIRNVSGGPGLIVDGAGVPVATTLVKQLVTSATSTSAVPAVPNVSRSAHLDALAFYVATGITTPLAPVGLDAAAVARGRAVFMGANCALCHGGTGWSTARLDYLPEANAPAASTRPALTVAGDGVTQNGDLRNDDVSSPVQLRRFLANVGTFFSNTVNELRFNAAALAAPVGLQAAGQFGFVPPSLLGIGGVGPYLHNGSELTLSGVLSNQVHRRAGTGIDSLSNPQDRDEDSDLVTFLKSIDDSTVAIQPTPGGAVVFPNP